MLWCINTDSPSTLESSLSPAELVPFHGCVIPPFMPQWDTPTEDSSLSCPNTHQEAHGPPSSAGASGAPAGVDLCVNFALRDAGQRQQEGTDTLRERNVHLRQLARRAKHLASVLEVSICWVASLNSPLCLCISSLLCFSQELMTVTEREETPPPDHRPSLSPCKRQRLDEGYETESSDSLEDMLRDISTRCNAVLHISTTAKQQGSGVVRVHGAFSGLQMSFCSNGGCPATDGAEADANIWSFRTSVREHGTMRTQAFPHGHSFTARTQEGGYRFRWVPNHS